MSSHPIPTAAEKAWEVWLAGQGTKFLLFARQQTRCEADAEDVRQEALVETWRRAQGRPESTLVYATIRRRAIDLARRTGRRQRREEAFAQPDGFIPSSDDGDIAHHLEKEIRRLPREQREVVMLKVWSGMTFAEVAQTLAIPPRTAASRYRLAVAALRGALSGILN